MHFIENTYLNLNEHLLLDLKSDLDFIQINQITEFVVARYFPFLQDRFMCILSGVSIRNTQKALKTTLQRFHDDEIREFFTRSILLSWNHLRFVTKFV